MLFNSVQFFAYFAIVYAAYLSFRHGWQNRLLLAASLVFYAAWDWRFLGLLMTTITLDYGVGRGLESLTSPRARRVLLACSLTASLGFLGFFKYYDFFVDSLAQLLTNVGIDAHGLHLDLVLPVGISFYTFHTMSYVIDVYYRRTTACRSYVDFALFVSFFPQLVAGPIARATQLLPQIQRARRITPEQIVSGVFLICVGLIEKVVIADGCAAVVNSVFGHESSFSGMDKLVAVYAFAFQILGDFAGYTDIARGVAKLMGFELVLNFNLPYFATNPSDFWRRWHISLSTWLRDYLYIPLGGNRRGTLATYRNLFVTMVLGGIWHGAAWTMVAWGAYHGLLLVLHRLVTGDRDRGVERQRPAWRNAIQIILTFQAVCFGWLIFRASDLGQVARFVGSITTDLTPSPHTGAFMAVVGQLVGPLLAYQLVQYRAGTLDVFVGWSVSRRAAFVCVTCWFVAAFLAFHRSLLHLGTPFIYFQF